MNILVFRGPGSENIDFERSWERKGNNLSKKLLEESRELRKFTNNELEEMISDYSEKLKKYT